MANYHILIIDDQKDVRRVLAGGLQTLGQQIDVIEVPSAEEAMLLAPRQRFDLIVCDVRLPGISGLDLVNRLRKYSPNLKIILMTGTSDPQVRKQVEAAGTFAFFYKPIEMSDFLDAVERALGLVPTAFPPPPLSFETEKRTAQAVEIKQPIPPLIPPQPEKQIPGEEVLHKLLAELSAEAAYCLENNGDIVYQAGSLNEHVTENSLLAAASRVGRSNISLSHAAGRSEPSYVTLISGASYQLGLAPVGRKYILLVVVRSRQFDAVQVEKALRLTANGLLQHLEPPAPMQKQAARVESTLFARPSEASKLAAKSPAPEHDLLADLEKVELTPADIAAVDDLFKPQATIKQQVDNLDDFWNSAAEKAGEMKLKDNHISFDQAQQMGLAPED